MRVILITEWAILFYVATMPFEVVSFFGLGLTAIVGGVLTAIELTSSTTNNKDNYQDSQPH